MLKPVIQTSLDWFRLLLFDPCKIQKSSVFVLVSRCQNKSALLLRHFRMNVNILSFLLFRWSKSLLTSRFSSGCVFVFPLLHLESFMLSWSEFLCLCFSVIQNLWVSVNSCVSFSVRLMTKCGFWILYYRFTDVTLVHYLFILLIICDSIFDRFIRL